MKSTKTVHLPVTWLCAALSIVSALLMLYIPSQFYNDQWRYMYPFLRPFGGAFALSAVLITLDLAKVGAPRWLTTFGRVLFVVASGGWVGLQIIFLGPKPGFIANFAVIGGFLIASRWPDLEPLLLRGIYLAILLVIGGVILASRFTDSVTYRMYPLWVDPLFLMAGLLQVFTFRTARQPRWLPSVSMYVTLLPLSYYSYLWLRTGNWAGSGIALTLFGGALVYALYTSRPWHLQVPGLRRRILTLALALGVIPTLGIGAYAVFRIGEYGRTQNFSLLRQVALHLENELDAGKLVPLGAQLPPGGLPLQRTWLPSGMEARLHPIERTPVPGESGLVALEDQSPTRLVATMRRPDLGVTITVSEPTVVAYAQAGNIGIGLLFGALVVGGAATALALVLSGRITDQLSKVRAVIAAVREQQFEVLGARDATTDDEIAGLSQTVEEMARALAASSRELQRQNDALQLQAEEIMAQNDALKAQSDILEQQAAQLRSETAERELEHLRLSVMLSVLPVGVFIADGAGKLIEANLAAKEIWGEVPLADSIAAYSQYRARWSPTGEQVEAHEWPIARVLQTGEPCFHEEMEIETFDGKQKTTIVSAVPVRDERGTIANVVAVVIDITERKRMEERIRSKETLLAILREVLEQVASGASLPVVLETVARFTETSIGECHSIILLLDETKQQTRVAAIPTAPPALAALAELHGDDTYGRLLSRHLIDGTPLIVADIASDQDWKPVADVVHAHGVGSIWLFPVHLSSGESIGAITVAVKGTRTPSEHELRTLEVAANLIGIALERHQHEEGRAQKLHSVLQHMAEGVVAIDRQRELFFINPAAALLLQVTIVPEQRAVEQLGLPESLVEVMVQSSQPGSYTPERVTFIHHGREVEAHVSPVYTDLGRYGAVAVLQDVTAEQQLRRLQESFVANVSHELRGPLASISVAMEALADGMVSEEQRPRYFRSMLAEMGRLRRLSNDVIDLTCLDSGISRLLLEPVSLRAVFENMRDRLSPRCAEECLDLVVEQTQLYVMGDADRIDQVIANLLENAIRYTPAGGMIKVQADLEGSVVRMSVLDSGIGIPAEHLPYVWERFYKVDPARTLMPNSGTGLGLAIVKQLVELMGGEIKVESDPGSGSAFSFTLPLSLEAAST